MEKTYRKANGAEMNLVRVEGNYPRLRLTEVQNASGGLDITATGTKEDIDRWYARIEDDLQDVPPTQEQKQAHLVAVKEKAIERRRVLREKELAILRKKYEL